MVKLWRISFVGEIVSTRIDVIGDDITKVLEKLDKHFKKNYIDVTLKDITNVELRGDTGND